MNMRLRRYFPLLGAVAFIAICVFLGRSENLASYAGGAGCSGSAGVAQDLSGLGTADDQTRANVAELANIPMIGSEVQLQDDAATIKRLEDALTRDAIGAAPAVAEKFQEAGCYAPGSSRLAELIEKVATADSITPTQRTIFVNVLLNTASFAVTQAPTPNFQLEQKNSEIGRIQLPNAVIADTRLEESFAKIRTAIAENNGGVVRESIEQLANAETPKLDADRLAEFNQQTCSIKAFEAVRAIVVAQVESPEKTAYRILDSLDVLKPMDKGAYSLVSALASVAPAVKPWDSHFLSIAMNKNFDAHTRGLACKSAAARGNDLSAIAKVAEDVTLPEQLLVCLKEYQPEGQALPGSLTGVGQINDLDSTIEQLRNDQAEVDAARTKTNLENLFDPTRITYFSNIGNLSGLNANTISLREQFAKADTVARDFGRMGPDSRQTFLEDLNRLEAASLENQHFGRFFRKLLARRTSAEIAGIKVTAQEGSENPQLINQNSDEDESKREIDLTKAVKEIQKANGGTNGLKTLNPAAKPMKEDGNEVNNGAPIKLPKMGQ